MLQIEYMECRTGGGLDKVGIEGFYLFGPAASTMAYHALTMILIRQNMNTALSPVYTRISIWM